MILTVVSFIFWPNKVHKANSISQQLQNLNLPPQKKIKSNAVNVCVCLKTICIDFYFLGENNQENYFEFLSIEMQIQHSRWVMWLWKQVWQFYEHWRGDILVVD